MIYGSYLPLQAQKPQDEDVRHLTARSTNFTGLAAVLSKDSIESVMLGTLPPIARERKLMLLVFDGNSSGAVPIRNQALSRNALHK
jgi:hypothetical protein